ncbi:MAG: methytransferase partner Trm112 [Chloroflexota bacterium]
MRKSLMEILACPVCKGTLQLNVEEEDETEVITGTLYCAKCNEHYPIKESIPNLLPPSMRGNS